MIPTSDIIVQKNTEPESCNDRTDFLGAVIVLYFAVIVDRGTARKNVLIVKYVHKVFRTTLVVNVPEPRTVIKSVFVNG